MMVIPSIFLPEDWSFTFYEGINRHPDSIFKDRTVTELGCGNGWISIAIAEKWLPSKVSFKNVFPFQPLPIFYANTNYFCRSMALISILEQ
jgi:methionine S-methyltransferase